MIKLAAGIIAASVLVAWMLDGTAPSAAPVVRTSPAPEPAMPAAPIVTPAGIVALARAADGHFYADGTINGTAQSFLVDTGASSVAFGRDEARRFGLFVTDSDFTQTGRTAAGPIRVAPIVIRRMTVGAITATDIRGAVVDLPSLQPLLGQSFLSELSEVTIAGNRMELR